MNWASRKFSSAHAKIAVSERAQRVASLDYDPSIPDLKADDAALRQVMLNLVLNANQAGASQIVIRTRVEHGSSLIQPGQSMAIRVDVEDDGEGVPEHLRPLLFLPLVTGKREGTGLGLALSQQIAAAHGGLISYQDRTRTQVPSSTWVWVTSKVELAGAWLKSLETSGRSS